MASAKTYNLEGAETGSVELDDAVFQLIHINGILRKLIVDSNRDGNSDFALVNGDSDPDPDVKFLFSSPWPLVDWLPESIN